MARVHLIGIGGVGMAGLAVLLRSEGHEVTGCDLKETPRTRWLAMQGVRVLIGHDEAHVREVDEVVITPAVASDSAELLAASGRVRVRSRGEVLAELANARETIAVCGSHGKTTTATWTAQLLHALGEDVAWCIGGETGDFPVAHTGSGPLIVEADESDGTLALYRAATLIVNRLDYDHPDHFRTCADYFACFDTARAQANEVIESEALELDLSSWPELLPLEPHNRRNARAAIEVACRRGHAPGQIRAVLPRILSRLPDRRFEKIADGVYTDYAHHPTEMACAVRMARTRCRGTLRVLFQPHRYSRTKALLESFPTAFAGADEVILCPTYAAFEHPVEGGDIADLYRICRERLAGVRLYLARSCAEAWEHVRNTRTSDDLVLLLGAGDIIDLAPQIRANLAVPRRKVWIGASTNTWRSDLVLAIDYVKTNGPASEPGAALVAAHPTLIPWMAGIPGTIGGWIKMNAGAFGHSFSEALEAVRVDGVWISAENCGFGYRTSAITGEIQDFRLKLDPPTGEGTPADYLARRRRFPAGTFGSCFKNPPSDFAGRLLEAAGVKGLRVGGAFVWSEHANVIVRGEGATPSDVLALARLMHERVLFRLGIDLEPEVCGLNFAHRRKGASVV